MASSQTTVDDLKARLIGQPLMLRGFWMDGEPMANYKTGPFSESGFDAQKVKLHGDKLVIEGQRVALAFVKDGTAQRLPMTHGTYGRSIPDDVTITIDGQGNPDFSKELDTIFAAHLDDILPSLPDYWQLIARRILRAEGHAAHAPKDPAKASVMHIAGNVTRPVILTKVEPEFTDVARQHKFSGDCMLYLWVGPDGVPSHIAIVRPVGLGLDENAVAALSKYKFSPATLGGKPVTVDLYVDVGFRIFWP